MPGNCGRGWRLLKVFLQGIRGGKECSPGSRGSGPSPSYLQLISKVPDLHTLGSGHPDVSVNILFLLLLSLAILFIELGQKTVG